MTYRIIAEKELKSFNFDGEIVHCTFLNGRNESCPATCLTCDSGELVFYQNEDISLIIDLEDKSKKNAGITKRVSSLEKSLQALQYKVEYMNKRQIEDNNRLSAAIMNDEVYAEDVRMRVSDIEEKLHD